MPGQTFLTPGSFTFVVPPGVFLLDCAGIGPGGRGGSFNDFIGSGGGGAYASSVGVAVTPGEALLVLVSDPAALQTDESGNVRLRRAGVDLFLVQGGQGGDSSTGGLANDCVFNLLAFSGGNGFVKQSQGDACGGGGGAGSGGPGGDANKDTPGVGGAGNPTGVGGASPSWVGGNLGGGGGSPGTFPDPTFRPPGGNGFLTLSWADPVGATVVDQAALAYAILDTARFTVEKDEDPSP